MEKLLALLYQVSAGKISDGPNLLRFGFSKVRRMPNLRGNFGKHLADACACKSTRINHATVPDLTRLHLC